MEYKTKENHSKRHDKEYIERICFHITPWLRNQNNSSHDLGFLSNPQLRRGSKPGDKGLVKIADEARVQKLIQRILQRGFLEKLQVIVYRVHGIRADGAAGSS